MRDSSFNDYESYCGVVKVKNFMAKASFLGLALLSMLTSADVAAAESKDAYPSIKIGAEVFKERCVLCHGSAAMGEGILPLKLKDYPSTNLIDGIKELNRVQIKRAIVYGGTQGELSEYMPPMGNDLSWTETESVVDFVVLLKNNKKAGLKLLKEVVAKVDASRALGQQLFESRCALCHGKYGEGDGRMAKVLKAPPPANLTRSRLPDDYLKKIIIEGGEGVGRSPKMPPWGMQFEDNEINSIIMYVKSIRR